MAELINILLADDEGETLAEGFSPGFRKAGFNLLTETYADRVLERVKTDQPAAVLLDVIFPTVRGYERVGLELIRTLKEQYPALPVVLLTATLSDGQNPLDEQALDLAYFSFGKDSLCGDNPQAALQQLIGQVRAAVDSSAQTASLDEHLGFYVGETARMKKLAEEAILLASAELPVLITGEPGTGKEELARAIHRLSARNTGPFVAINCGQFRNEDLLQSELFGYEKGAHSTAREAKPGVIESASGGTLFLDEIQAMTLTVQQILLRALQERKVRRLGANGDRKVDVRFISATNADLTKMMDSGAFRPDIFGRLKGALIQLPPLRERKEDILALAQRFIREANAEAKRQVPVNETLRPEVLGLLRDYDWPGNIRELRNAIFRAVALARSTVLTSSLFDLTPPQLIDQTRQPQASVVAPLSVSGKELTWSALLQTRGELRRTVLIDFIRQVEAERGSKPTGKELAGRLGVTWDNLRRVLSEAGIELRKWPN
jgi:DNA-binding NtrC family response regulator